MSFLIRPEPVFIDMNLDRILSQKLGDIFFDINMAVKGVDYVTNEIYPLIPKDLNVFPKSLNEYMKKRGYGSNPVFNILHTYLQTYYMAVSFSENIKNNSYVGMGFKIINAHKECSMCLKLDGVKYHWNELDNMPSLPLHWGCRCTIAIFFEDIEKQKIIKTPDDTLGAQDCTFTAQKPLNFIYEIVGLTGKAVLYPTQIVIEKRPFIKKVVSKIDFAYLEEVHFRLYNKSTKKSGFIRFLETGTEPIDYNRDMILTDLVTVVCSGVNYNAQILSFCEGLKTIGIAVIEI